MGVTYENIPLHPEKGSRWDLPPGTYHFNPDARDNGTIGVLIVSCPRGTKEEMHIATLPHGVKEDGTVHPSIVCPYEGCTWHVWGRLLGWQWGERAAREEK